MTTLPLEGEGPDGEAWELPLADTTDIEAEFQREWVLGLMALAVEALRKRCAGTSRAVAFALFERYDLQDHEPAERPRYQDLAGEFDLPVTQVTNHLYWARRELRQSVLETLREITASEQEFRLRRAPSSERSLRERAERPRARPPAPGRAVAGSDRHALRAPG